MTKNKVQTIFSFTDEQVRHMILAELHKLGLKVQASQLCFITTDDGDVQLVIKTEVNAENKTLKELLAQQHKTESKNEKSE